MKNAEEFFKPKRNSIKKSFEKNIEIEKKAEEQKIKPKKSIKKILTFVFLVIFILAFLGFVGATGYFYQQYKKATIKSVSEDKVEVEIIVEKIKKFMELPDETPTLATVSDKDKLKNQEFFAKTENGDKVLIYVGAKKAILYRPSIEKVIEVSVLSETKPSLEQENVKSDNNANISPTPNLILTLTPTPQEVINNNIQEESKKDGVLDSIEISIYNGTSTAGLAKSLADKISGLENITVISKTNAKNNYTKNLVIDLSGKNAVATQKIADKIEGEIQNNLPEGEKKPEADILIIGGKE